MPPTPKKSGVKVEEEKAEQKPSAKAKAAAEEVTQVIEKKADKQDKADKPKGAKHVPADPILAFNHARSQKVADAIERLDDALGSEEQAAEHSADLLAARQLFQSLRYNEPFRFLIYLAVEG